MVPMDITVSTTALVTVGMILHVTNRLVNVTRDVNRDIPIVTVEKVDVYIIC